MVRILLSFGILSFFALSAGHAMEVEPFTKGKSTPSNSKKRKADLIDSPMKEERLYWGPARKKLTLAEYYDFSLELQEQLVKKEEPSLKNKRKNPVDSPEAREIFKKLRNTFWSRNIRFKGKIVYQNDSLIDPYAKFWTTDGLKTNLELMKEGHAPLIQREDKIYRIELHHLTQKDTNTKEDPIVEMTSRCHMGREDRMILEVDPKTGKLRIVYSDLTKEETLKLCKPGQFIATDALHFRKGKSLIDREEFDSWRKNYWIYRAEEIENGIFVEKEKLPPLDDPIDFFKSPVKSEKKFGLNPGVQKKLAFSNPNSNPLKEINL